MSSAIQVHTVNNTIKETHWTVADIQVILKKHRGQQISRPEHTPHLPQCSASIQISRQVTVNEMGSCLDCVSLDLPLDLPLHRLPEKQLGIWILLVICKKFHKQLNSISRMHLYQLESKKPSCLTRHWTNQMKAKRAQGNANIWYWMQLVHANYNHVESASRKQTHSLCIGLPSKFLVTVPS